MRERTEGPAGTKLPDYKGLLCHVKLELNYYQQWEPLGSCKQGVTQSSCTHIGCCVGNGLETGSQGTCQGDPAVVQQERNVPEGKVEGLGWVGEKAAGPEFRISYSATSVLFWGVWFCVVLQKGCKYSPRGHQLQRTFPTGTQDVRHVDSVSPRPFGSHWGRN